MKRLFVPVLAALVFASLGARAQQIGEYDGTTADGSSVAIQVAQDPNNSSLEVKVLGFGISMDCAKSGETLRNIGIGLLDGADIVDGKFSYASSDFYSIDLVTSMTFHGLNSVKGKVGANLAAFNPANGHDTLTKAIQVCSAPKQSFTATYVGAARQDTSPGTVRIGGRSLIER